MMSTNSKASTGANRSGPGAGDELKRTLERDTAVQGESDSEEAATTRGPGGGDTATPSARPASAARRRNTTS